MSTTTITPETGAALGLLVLLIVAAILYRLVVLPLTDPWHGITPGPYDGDPYVWDDEDDERLINETMWAYQFSAPDPYDAAYFVPGVKYVPGCWPEEVIA